MREMNVNDFIKEFNRFYLDDTLENELAILGIGADRRFKREQFNELYKPIFLTLWVHALDTHHAEQSDKIRDAYLKGLKQCYRKQKGEFERTMGLVIDFEAMLGDFSPNSFHVCAEQIVKRVSRNKEAQKARTLGMAQCIQEKQEALNDLVKNARFVA